ncbi:hypothetical protein SCLCIDRAFT_1050049 [Scleroderma citrinum Foug A]|uniref:Uncharacterized protein n=1 Tax=Scleroderma citrinum Foug A TaxID=1036808 RepID=A0A0C3DRR9_9AGAM|nr:hypothetical protein SCLCIDRAFT_1050049 [Scleroderma citrinum Foug A]
MISILISAPFRCQQYRLTGRVVILQFEALRVGELQPGPPVPHGHENWLHCLILNATSQEFQRRGPVRTQSHGNVRRCVTGNERKGARHITSPHKNFTGELFHNHHVVSVCNSTCVSANASKSCSRPPV